jgi:hypothetical protein
MLNLPQRTGVEKDAKLSLHDLTWVKQQRLRMEAGKQANLLEELLAPSRDLEKHKS